MINKNQCPYFLLNNCINTLNCEGCKYQALAIVKKNIKTKKHNQCLECDNFCNGCDGDIEPCEAFEYVR